jgi:hypothetical protein
MRAKFCNRLRKRESSAKTTTLRQRIVQATDWRQLRSAFLLRLRELKASTNISPELDGATLVSARRVRLVHLHGGRPQRNPALRPLRLRNMAEAAGGEEAKLAMVVWALLHNRDLSYRLRDSGNACLRAFRAIRQVHPVTADLDWVPGSNMCCRSGGISVTGR